MKHKAIIRGKESNDDGNSTACTHVVSISLRPFDSYRPFLFFFIVASLYEFMSLSLLNSFLCSPQRLLAISGVVHPSLTLSHCAGACLRPLVSGYGFCILISYTICDPILDGDRRSFAAIPLEKIIHY